jgi:catalase
MEYSSDVTEEDWEQPRSLWKIFKESGEDKVLIENLSQHMNKALPEVKKAAIGMLPLCPSYCCTNIYPTEMWTKVDEEIGKRLEDALKQRSPNVDHMRLQPSERVLATHKK